MSWFNTDDPKPGDDRSVAAIEHVIVPRARDLGGFEVRRALPSAKRQMVGPFIFFDQMGPVEFVRGEGIDVRPHPHIGLATVTYLLSGEIMHRDSLGTEQAIRPGALNLMTAGRGIVHSERTDPVLKAAGTDLFGLQSWVALPRTHEEGAPAFEHVDAHALPVVKGPGIRVRVIAGTLFGETAPTRTAWDTLYGDAELAGGVSMPLDAAAEERAIYTLKGTIRIAGDRFGPGQLLVFRPGDAITIAAEEDARFMIFGGATMDGPRHIWWNFVSSSKERIAQAKEDWRQGRFDTVPGDAEEFIPLP
ncbi:MAG: pirin family protein [Hyphomicrobiaceae bacterium]|nr:pirin family protein [Hyphomicrobiaceae bacterium]